MGAMHAYGVLSEVLYDTATRLDVAIQTKVAMKLQGATWAQALKIIDQKKGFYKDPSHYVRQDMSLQLLFLTIPLPLLGNPFFDGTYRIQKLAAALRDLRNNWAHFDPSIDLTVARNAADLASALFEQLGAQQDSIALRDRRVLIENEIIQVEPGSLSRKPMRALVDEPVEPIDAPIPAPAELVIPSPEMFARKGAKIVVAPGEKSNPVLEKIAEQREPYYPWNLVRIGEPDVILDLPKKAAKEAVRSLATDIAEFEGPIHVDRLARMVAHSFGVNRLHEPRKKQIIHQIKVSAGLTVDSDKFVWPEAIDAAIWREFRPNSSDQRRDFDSISPVEIANVISFVRTAHPGLPSAELDRKVLETFGRKAKTAPVRKHLARAYEVELHRGAHVPGVGENL